MCRGRVRPPRELEDAYCDGAELELGWPYRIICRRSRIGIEMGVLNSLDGLLRLESTQGARKVNGLRILIPSMMLLSGHPRK